MNYNRILIVRTDRIGDVVLSTPVAMSLRAAFPKSYIAMMVSPEAREIVEGNPYLDEVIIYDKKNKHKSIFNSIKFSLWLKQKKFDIAIILHTTNRVNLITFFAGIPKRVGYARRLSFLLTDKLKDVKHTGQKHEIEYNLDVIRAIGINPVNPKPFVVLKEENKNYIEQILKQSLIETKDRIVVMHPGASCISKRWPLENFSELGDRLIRDFSVKLIIVSSPEQKELANKVCTNMKEGALNLAGMTSIGQLASLIKRASLFISNDSGPVHIASSVDTPVISIFGRKQPGLSPKRWGPVGFKDRFLHRDVGCIVCLAHNCQKEFACIRKISVDDVINISKEILNA